MFARLVPRNAPSIFPCTAGINCDFTVEELSKRTKTIVVDPFMVLHVAGRKLYIDVWNEPKFEGRRTK